MTRLTRWIVPALLLTLLSAADVSARQRWIDLYDQALQHVRRGEYNDAETKLLASIKLAPNNRRRAIRRQGMLFDDYMPEYYLGVVYTLTNRPKLALTMFAAARAAKIDEGSGDFRQITAFEQKAKAALALMADAGAKPPVADPGAKPPVTDPGSKPTAVTPDPTIEKPAPPVTPDPTPPPAPPPAPNFRQQFADLMSKAMGAFKQRNLDDAQKLATAARDLAVKQSLTERPQADALLQDIDGTRRSTRIDDLVKGGNAAAARRELEALVVAVPRFPVDQLRGRVELLERQEQARGLQRDAMVAFFTGRYQQTLAILAQAEKLASLTARGHFYRACSLAAQAASAAADSTDEARMRQARQSYQVASKTPTEYKEDLRYISPRIRKMLGAP